MTQPLPPLLARYQPRHKFTPLWRDVALLWQVWTARAQSRRALGRLSAGQLDDVGISAMDAARESKKAFWRR